MRYTDGDLLGRARQEPPTLALHDQPLANQVVENLNHQQWIAATVAMHQAAQAPRQLAAAKFRCQVISNVLLRQALQRYLLTQPVAEQILPEALQPSCRVVSLLATIFG